MNIVKFKDVVMTPEVLLEAGYVTKNVYARNNYMKQTLLPMDITPGNTFQYKSYNAGESEYMATGVVEILDQNDMVDDERYQGPDTVLVEVLENSITGFDHLKYVVKKPADLTDYSQRLKLFTMDEPTNIWVNITGHTDNNEYLFESHDETGGLLYGTGKVKIIRAATNWTMVRVTENSTDQSYVGRKFIVHVDSRVITNTNGSGEILDLIQLYTPGEDTGMEVTLDEQYNEDMVYNILDPETVSKFGTPDNNLIGVYDDNPDNWSSLTDIYGNETMVYIYHTPEEFEAMIMTGADVSDYTELVSDEYNWTADSPIAEQFTIEEFCHYFNNLLRNKYAYAVNWTHIMPLNSVIDGTPIPVGDPFNPDTEVTYVNAEIGLLDIDHLMKFSDLKLWMDQVNTLSILQNDRTKYDYLNEFTPDDEITIEELKVFRTWLASILLANTPMINGWSNPDMLTAMLTYYKQNLKDTTTDILTNFSVYMANNILVAGTSQVNKVNLAALGLSSGCGCFGGVQGVGSVAATTGCDPLQMYRNAIYNYMVETFSNVDYWMEQVEICVEMKKYLEGILKVGLPLGSKIIDPYADCGCNTMDSDTQVRYRKMIEALIQSLTYIIEGKVSGNRNYVATAFSNWATYLYEYMYWV